MVAGPDSEALIAGADDLGRGAAIWEEYSPDASNYKLQVARYDGDRWIRLGTARASRNPLTVQLAVADSGFAVITWVEGLTAPQVSATTLDLATGPQSATHSLAASSFSGSHGLLARAASSGAIVAWGEGSLAGYPDGVVHASIFGSGTGSWSSDSPLAANLAAGDQVQLLDAAINSVGDAVVLSLVEPLTGPLASLEASFYSARDGRWAPPLLISNDVTPPLVANVALDDSGVATIVWEKSELWATRASISVGVDRHPTVFDPLGGEMTLDLRMVGNARCSARIAALTARDSAGQTSLYVSEWSGNAWSPLQSVWTASQTFDLADLSMTAEGTPVALLDATEGLLGAVLDPGRGRATLFSIAPASVELGGASLGAGGRKTFACWYGYTACGPAGYITTLSWY
jgi:hypothetical protein